MTPAITSEPAIRNPHQFLRVTAVICLTVGTVLALAVYGAWEVWRK